jgi:hypothetical protein
LPDCQLNRCGGGGMVDIKDIRKILIEHKSHVKEKFKVKEIGIFGSYVRGEQKWSNDVDVLVGFEKTPTLLEFIELENYLIEFLGVKVDLIMKGTLKPNIREQVLKEVV